MAKGSIKIGYSIQQEIRPGVWQDTVPVVEEYKCLIKSNPYIAQSRLSNNPDSTTKSISCADELSFFADPFALSNYIYIEYVEYLGVKWKPATVRYKNPRIYITLGGVYGSR